jgi:hypothetical protein
MLDTSLVYKDGVYYDAIGRPLSYTVDGLRAKVDLAASGTVVAAVAGYKIRVLGFVVSALGATAIKFQSAATTDISLTMSLAATSGFVVPQNPVGWFETVVSEALTLNMTVATTVGVQVIYALVQ